MARPNLQGDSASFLSWFFELLTMDKVRVIGLLLSASAFTWQVGTAAFRALNETLKKRRAKK